MIDNFKELSLNIVLFIIGMIALGGLMLLGIGMLNS